MYSILNPNNSDQLDVTVLHPSKMTEMYRQKYCPVIMHSIVLLLLTAVAF